MWPTLIVAVAMALLPTSGLAIPPSCPGIPPIRYPYELARGWTAVKVADGLSSPRGLLIDGRGRILIVEEGLGISQHTVDINGCIMSSRKLVSMTALNHGIYLGLDGRTLYASSASTVFKWGYDPESGNISEPPTIVVSGMAISGHVTRTLIIPPHHPNLLVVSHGSNGNVDYAAADPATARAIVKVFDISTVPNGGYDFAQDGWDAGYGLRNEVGLAFDGNNMLWGVENSADQLTRDVNGTSTDIHNDNPAEELNFIGDVSAPNKAWYGYPTCFTIWEPDISIDSPMHKLGVGQQFVVAPNETFNDDTCAHISTPPRLSFQAHSAPLDAKFDEPQYTRLFVTLHGSWNRYPPTGFKLIAVPFTRIIDDGSYTPIASSSSKSGYVDIFYPPNEGQCSPSSCARPVGLVFDMAGRLYMTSDTSGEVLMLGMKMGDQKGAKGLVPMTDIKPDSYSIYNEYR